MFGKQLLQIFLICFQNNFLVLILYTIFELEQLSINIAIRILVRPVLHFRKNIGVKILKQDRKVK